MKDNKKIQAKRLKKLDSTLPTKPNIGVIWKRLDDNLEPTLCFVKFNSYDDREYYYTTIDFEKLTKINDEALYNITSIAIKKLSK